MNESDPRAKRTRHLLAEAFGALMAEKEFASITIQDIADRATVNRATFYAHFEDKFALLDRIVREDFREKVLATLPPTLDLRQTFCAVAEFLVAFTGQCPKKNREFHPLVEATIQDELHSYILSEATGAAATALSWAIFGVAREWSRGPRSEPVERAAGRVVEFLSSILNPTGILRKP